ncbi:MAG: efflux RND transporter permease subunit [Deltaproteobacteria bacterium]|jgi:multidrug efflux pump subunit AcrB
MMVENRAGLGSSFVNLFNKFNQVFQVYIQASNRYRLQHRDIQNLYVRNGLGEMIPLGTLIRFNWTRGSELITHYSLYPAAVILAVSMAVVGILLALIIRGFDNNLYTQVGLVLMIALASKNAILIVEFARDLQRWGRRQKMSK